MGISEAIREALGKLGVEAETKAVKEYIVSHHKGIDPTSGSFASALSSMKTKMRGGPAKPSKKKKKQAPPAATTASQPIRIVTLNADPAAAGNGQVQLEIGLRQLVTLVGRDRAGQFVKQLMDS